MRLSTICISCMELPPLLKRARFLSEPPPNRLQKSASSSPCPILHDHFRRLLRAIQIEANLAETADKT